MLNRFIPSICAVVAFVGCLVPLKGSLIMLPAGYNVNFTTSGNPMFADMLKGMIQGLEAAKPLLDLAWGLALLAYIVPISAFAIVLVNLRGYVSKTMQVAVAIAWLALGIGLPMVTNSIAVQAFRKVTMVGMAIPINQSAVFSINAGDWLIAFAAATLLLAGFGLVRYVDAPAKPSPASD